MTRLNKKEDVEQRNYAAVLAQATLTLSQSQSRLDQAKLAYENAQQQEATQVAAAQADVDNAQTQIDELLKGPKAEDVAIAQSQVDQAQSSLDKLKAGGTPQDIASAQASLDQARANLQKMNEPATAADIKAAQAQVDQARIRLEKLQAGGTAADIAASQASLDQVRANLAQLTSASSEADIAAARSQVDQAQAQLDALSAPKSDTDLRIQQAAVDQALQNVRSAQLSYENATLKAPFAGIVTTVNIVPGSNASIAAAAVTIIDRSTLHVDVTLSENDVVQVAVGQQVNLSIDSLDNWQAAGKVTYIAPAATITNDVVTYAVRVSFPDDDPSVKVGMTADSEITTDEKRGVLLVPSTALLPNGANYVVEKLGSVVGTTDQVPVETGLSDDINTEITKGLSEGDQIIELPGSVNNNGGGGGPFGR